MPIIKKPTNTTAMIGSNAVVADDFIAVDGFKVVADICFVTFHLIGVLAHPRERNSRG